MANSAINAAADAIYTTLSGNGALTALVTGVYDQPRDGTAFPYVTIGDPFEVRSNTYGKGHRDVTFMIDVWSDYNGYDEAAPIADAVVAALDGATPSVTGYNVSDISHIGTRSFKERTQINDRAIRHMVIEFLMMLSVA